MSVATTGAFLKALIARLRDGGLPINAPYFALVAGRTYTHVPEKTDYPYSFVDLGAQDWSTKTDAGYDLTVAINIWSRDPSAEQVMAIRDALHACLHQQTFVMDSGQLLCLWFEASNATVDTDGATHLSTERYRAHITDTP
jgi:hypothetical protein